MGIFRGFFIFYSEVSEKSVWIMFEKLLETLKLKYWQTCKQNIWNGV